MKGIRNIFIFTILSLFCSSCLVGRFVWYNFSDITDYKIFPGRQLPKSPQPFRFGESKTTVINQNTAHYIDSLAASTPTVAVLVIQNDSILYEKYFRNYDAGSTVASFSMAKSYTSALIGIAIADGLIKSVDDKIIDYLPELAKRKGFDKITIKHLLQMTSGIKANESYFNPLGQAAKLYYGRNLRNYLSHLKTDYEPGTKFAYRSVNTQLLGWILERAVKKPVTEYFYEKLWQPMDMEYDASWSIDKKKNGLEKTFCCINAKARDYAKFGRLYLNRGNWNGKQLIPASWIDESTQVDTKEGSAWYYQYQWWLTNKAERNFTANGLHGEYIYVNPKHNMVIVRLGKNPGDAGWFQEMEKIAKMTNKESVPASKPQPKEGKKKKS
jgi:CubicO group peptidase (beta-lactamase class C family)